MNIYVGNLSYGVTEEDLKQAFEGFGQVETVKIIKDRYSGESKGFGFVEMPAKDEAESAINDLNGKDLKGRALNVSEARPRTQGPRGGGRPSGGRRDGRRRSY
jgi:RNA recognition motif-containing protein